MENASKEIKDISDVVTLTNEECGVAHAIETYILNAELNKMFIVVKSSI
mgnify:CR=1 FL=1